MEELLIISLCLFLNALFAGYEMAFVSVPKTELKNASKKGSVLAKKLVEFRTHPERTLSIIQIGITLVGAVAAAVGGAGAAENLEPYLMSRFGMREAYAEILSVFLVVAPITYLSVVVGELVPKTLALKNPMRIVMAGAPALLVADRILSPIVSILEGSTKLILRLFFRRQKNLSTEESPETIELDSLSATHRTLMLNMAAIETKTIQDMMVPWGEVNFVRESDTVEQVTQMVLTSGHTRLPVLANGNIRGILHTKEFLALKESGESQWTQIIRPALHVRTTEPALSMLALMQDRRSHMALVYTPKGERCGIVTLEDIMEEVVGDIFDEDDDGRVRKIFASRAKRRVNL